MNKKKAYLKAKIEEPKYNSKINNITDLYRGINDFKKGYQLRTTRADHLIPGLIFFPGNYNTYRSGKSVGHVATLCIRSVEACK